MVNPFGEESDSVIVWRERYKAKEFEVQTLQMRVGELKGLLDKSVEDFQEQKREMEGLLTELNQAKQELSRISSMLSDKQGLLDNLEQSLETESMASLKAENKKYREEIEELQAQLARSGGQVDDSSDISSTFIPLMLKIYDPPTSRYDDGFNNFIENIIQNGDVYQKIIAALIKRDGTSTIETTKATVNSEDFEVALEYLLDNEIVKVVDYQIMLQSSETMVSIDKDWDKMNISEVFDFMKEILETESDQNVVKAIENFRDTLQEREVPAKMFFEIRKMSEGIDAKTMSRQEAVEQVEDWRRRVGTT